jgi:hypothetical protein
MIRGQARGLSPLFSEIAIAKYYELIPKLKMATPFLVLKTLTGFSF